jgi:5-methylcytosine-specific restriction endonuclease McrA
MIGPRVSPFDLRRAKQPPKAADPFLLSPEWRELMKRIIAERGRRCQGCGREGCRVFGDHIVERKDGGALLDPANVMLRCGSCHTRKTTAERARRMAPS